MRWKRNDVGGCRKMLEQVIARSPDHVNANLLLAELCLLEERPEKMIKTIRRLAEANPANAELQHTLGLLLDATGNLEEALAYYRKAAEMEPGQEIFKLSLKEATTPGRKARKARSPAVTATNTVRTTSQARLADARRPTASGASRCTPRRRRSGVRPRCASS